MSTYKAGLLPGIMQNIMHNIEHSGDEAPSHLPPFLLLEPRMASWLGLFCSSQRCTQDVTIYYYWGVTITIICTAFQKFRIPKLPGSPTDMKVMWFLTT